MNVYWCMTDDADEDWFIVAESAVEAAQMHEELEGYDDGDAWAELVCKIPDDVEAEIGWPDRALLQSLGFTFVPRDGPRTVIFQGRVFNEGDMIENMDIERSMSKQLPI